MPTFTSVICKLISLPNNSTLSPHGIIALVIMAVNIANAGPSINKNLFEKFGMISSLKNNFKPSAKGCNKPKGPALFGPRRSCKMAATFLSANVVYMAMTNEAEITTTININFSITKPRSIANNIINYFLKSPECAGPLMSLR